MVVLIISLGAAALGMIIGTRNLVIEAMAGGWRSINPAMIGLVASPAIDEETIDRLNRLDGLEKVEGYSQVNIEWRLSPEERWRPAALVSRFDYENQSYNKISLLSGDWPEEKNLAAEDSAITAFGVPANGNIYIKSRGKERLVRVDGVINDEVTQPPNFGGNAQFYASEDYFQELTGQSGFNIILAGAAEYDHEALDLVAVEIQDKLEKQDVDSGSFLFERVIDPNKHFFQDIMDGIFLVLGIMAVFALFLSLFLVYNTVNALISQQINQIGVMKAVGARTRQILGTYLLLVLGYSLLALAVALLLGAAGGWFLTVFLTSSFNADPGAFVVSWPAVAAQLIVVFATPMLAALVPIINGSRITVNQAINTYGLSVKPNLLDRTLANVRHLPRILLLTISNTFRKKGRVLLTEITLVLSGLIFIMVMTAQESAAFTFGDLLFDILKFDINMLVREPERITRLEQLTLSHPNVEAAEMWGLNLASIRPLDASATYDPRSSVIFGVPNPTELYGPQMRSGRWLLPDDEYAVVLNQSLATDAGVGLGDWITFDHGAAGESDWLVVGLLFDPVITNSAHVPRVVLARELGQAGKAISLWIQTDRHDPRGQLAIAESLRTYYEANQIDVTPTGIFNADTGGEIRAQILNNFGVIVTLLMTMAFVIAIVGGIALSGTLSLNVIERRREIGVMRAIGAKSREVGLIFVGEGLILGLLSWFIAVPLSIPTGRLMTEAIGSAIGNELVYKFSPSGAAIWLAIIVVLSVVASWLPSRSAIRLSVRESLAYQ
jgi:putative ABC transport system permease protein